MKHKLNEPQESRRGATLAMLLGNEAGARRVANARLCLPKQEGGGL